MNWTLLSQILWVLADLCILGALVLAVADTRRRAADALQHDGDGGGESGERHGEGG